MEKKNKFYESLFLGLFLIEMGPLPHCMVRPGFLDIKSHPDKESGTLCGLQGLRDQMHSHRALQTIQILKELLFLLNSHMLSKGVF